MYDNLSKKERATLIEKLIDKEELIALNFSKDSLMRRMLQLYKEKLDKMSDNLLTKISKTHGVD